jgi:hypothetical protein
VTECILCDPDGDVGEATAWCVECHRPVCDRHRSLPHDRCQVHPAPGTVSYALLQRVRERRDAMDRHPAGGAR